MQERQTSCWGQKRLYCLVINSIVNNIIVCTHAFDTLFVQVVRTTNGVTEDKIKGAPTIERFATRGSYPADDPTATPPHNGVPLLGNFLFNR